MRRHLIAETGNRGYPVIDLHDVFDLDYRRNGMRFECDKDAHCNGYARGIFADSIVRSRWFAELAGRNRATGPLTPDFVAILAGSPGTGTVYLYHRTGDDSL